MSHPILVSPSCRVLMVRALLRENKTRDTKEPRQPLDKVDDKVDQEINGRRSLWSSRWVAEFSMQVALQGYCRHDRCAPGC